MDTSHSASRGEEAHQHAKAGSKAAYHQEHQIKWKDMDMKRFFVVNTAFNFIVDGAIYPLDVVRTRMQVLGSSTIPTSYPNYTNSVNCLTTIIRQEGLRGLFKGFTISETGYVASHVLYYSVYESVKQTLQQKYTFNETHGNRNVFLTTAAAGGLADLACCIVAVPSEVATTRLQLQGPLAQARYKNGIDVLRQIWAAEGLRGWYRGFGATVLRNVPASCIWWGVYELTKNKLHNMEFRKSLPISSRENLTISSGESEVENEDPLIHILAGAAAGITATICTNPVDVAKTRLQSMDPSQQAASNKTTTISGGNKPTAAGVLRGVFARQNAVSMMVKMVREEGFRALGKGLLPALIISTPYSIFTILLYEEVKKWCVIK